MILKNIMKLKETKKDGDSLLNSIAWEVTIERNKDQELLISIFDISKQTIIIEYKVKTIQLRIDDELKSMIYNKSIDRV
ncbi:MAG: hypothetical protein RR835_02910 [Peptostreptococcaceae bacterium]